MKKTILITILFLSFCKLYGQACGKYIIKYIGHVEENQTMVKNLFFATPSFLENGTNIAIENQFFKETVIANNAFEVSLTSNLTNIFYTTEQLLKAYKKQHQYLTLKGNYLINNKLLEKTIKIPWNEIIVKKIKNEGGKTVFEINLGEIKIL